METNVMVKVERQMEREESWSLLENGLYGVLSTVDNNGQPYGVPLNYILNENNIYFHCALEGHKLENIKYNDKVSFTVVGDIEILASKFSIAYESVILFGIISMVEDEKEKGLALMNLVRKYSSEFVAEGELYIKNAINKCAVFKIEIQSWTGKHRLKSNS
ncbi:MAG: pyridoxamine 5'-phosphate oxidase family protein [Syntrophomonas sp.]|nr:pyridoxamine 5'-phosphate oxidase family protein [Syntrophomonas sp.]